MKKLVLFLLIISCQFSLAQIVNIPDPNFKSALIAAGVDTNNDGEIQVSEAEAQTFIDVSSDNISSLEGINSFVNLHTLFCYNNNLTALNVFNLTTLSRLRCGNNNLTSLDVTNQSNLTELWCAGNNLTQINLPSQNVLKQLYLDDNHISNSTDIVNFENLSGLQHLGLSENQLTVLDVTSLTKLKLVYCARNQIIELNVSGLQDLQVLECEENQIKTLDLSAASSLAYIWAWNNQLESLFIKNGLVDSGLHFYNNPTLEYICVDTEELEMIQQMVNNNGYSNCVVNSFCTFEPGGDVYHITGNVKIDVTGNGCGSADFQFPFLQFLVEDTDGNSGIYSTDSSGMYSMALPEGAYSINYQFPYMSYFDISPPSFSVNFPSDSSPFEQDICLTPNGTYNDLQIAIIPLEQARPGFDAKYKIVYANVGTTVLSGDVTLSFEENVLDFVLASVVPDNQTSGALTWSFANLAPLEFKTIDVTMNLNAPTETPPLNGGDVLCYEASISPVSGDESSEDNSFSLKQTVVNSFDPNDKTCLEGDVITPDLVGEYVHYLIRFENTGSASAIHVVIKDIIDTNKFDMSSFVPMNASHDYVTRIQNENEVEFIFENINLPFDDATNDGFVLFKIKTLPSLEVGDSFENNAEIYFDFNFPIITNVAETFIDNTASNDEFSLQSNLKIYPSPAENHLQIESQRFFDTIVVYDLTGKELQRIVSTESRLSQEIDVAHLESGIYYLTIQSGTSKTTQKFLKR